MSENEIPCRGMGIRLDSLTVVVVILYTHDDGRVPVQKEKLVRGLGGLWDPSITSVLFLLHVHDSGLRTVTNLQSLYSFLVILSMSFFPTSPSSLWSSLTTRSSVPSFSDRSSPYLPQSVTTIQVAWLFLETYSVMTGNNERRVWFGRRVTPTRFPDERAKVVTVLGRVVR